MQQPSLLAPPLRSTLDPRTEEFQENRDAMLKRLEEIESLLDEAELGGGQQHHERLAKRGKLPVREAHPLSGPGACAPRSARIPCGNGRRLAPATFDESRSGTSGNASVIAGCYVNPRMPWRTSVVLRCLPPACGPVNAQLSSARRPGERYSTASARSETGTNSTCLPRCASSPAARPPRCPRGR